MADSLKHRGALTRAIVRALAHPSYADVPMNELIVLLSDPRLIAADVRLTAIDAMISVTWDIAEHEGRNWSTAHEAHVLRRRGKVQPHFASLAFRIPNR